MKRSLDTISEKITLLNETTLNVMADQDSNAAIRNFTEVGIKILDADFGFAWRRSNEDKEYTLAYKSANTPYTPPQPRENAGNFIARKTKRPFFDSDVKTQNYEFKIRKYLKSYIIIPIFYKDYIYGNLVFCYTKRHMFTKDEVTLSYTIGNVAAQAMSIHRLLENERKTLALTKKQKETEVLLEQEKLKTEFIANAAHEFRTPLAIMRGNVDLALDAKKPNLKSERSALIAVRAEVEHLSSIVADLALFTSHGSNKQRDLDATEVDIVTILQKLRSRLQIIADKRNISVRLKISKKPVYIKGDPKYLERVFLNLIKNAITYGKKNGYVIIKIGTEKRTAVIQVIDNGIGIPKDDIPNIFERFFRTEKARKIRKVGTGLGLALSKWIVEMHGGSIGVQSADDKGSTFTVTLPLQKK